MRINCHVPITVRIVGVPTDDQLAAIGRALVRAVSSRLAEAERLLADRHAITFPEPGLSREAAPALAREAGALPPDVEETRADRGLFRLASARDDDPVPSTVERNVRLPIASGHAPQADLLGRHSPGVARLDTAGVRREEERRATVRRGGDPALPPITLPDPIADALHEARRTPPTPAGPPTRPSDRGQQRRTIEKFDPADLWLLPRVQDAMRRMAEYMERWEHSRRRPNPTFDAAYWMAFWSERFINSLQHILYHRGFHRGTRRAANMRVWHLEELAAAEAEIVRRSPPPAARAGAAQEIWAMGLAPQVDAARQAARAAWLADVDRAVDRFIVLTDNQTKFLTVQQQADPVLVKGLPTQEPVVLPAAAPDQLAADSVGSAESVVTLMRAVQRHWHGRKVKASNYLRHELGNPHFGNVEFLGKYSFDVFLDSFVKIRPDGFYEHEPTVEFFLAVERASVETNIGWLALYNDFDVAKQVNEHIGGFRVAFAGGGSPKDAPEAKLGSIHHGPAPFILHIHFNIMVGQRAALLLRGRDTQPINLGFTGDR